jgi:hypothetical protein
MRKFKSNIIRNILEKNKNQYISLKKLRRLYREEDPSFDFSTETLRQYITKHRRRFFSRREIYQQVLMLRENSIKHSIFEKFYQYPQCK